MNETKTVTEVRKLLNDLQKSFQCTICLDLLSQPISTKCNHQFCSKCLNDLLTKSSKKRPVRCPLCKAKVTKRGINSNPKLSGIVHGVRDLCNAADEDCTNLGTTPLLSQRHRTVVNQESKNKSAHDKRKSLSFLGSDKEKRGKSSSVFDFDEYNCDEPSVTLKESIETKSYSKRKSASHSASNKHSEHQEENKPHTVTETKCDHSDIIALETNKEDKQKQTYNVTGVDETNDLLGRIKSRRRKSQATTTTLIEDDKITGKRKSDEVNTNIEVTTRRTKKRKKLFNPQSKVQLGTADVGISNNLLSPPIKYNNVVAENSEIDFKAEPKSRLRKPRKTKIQISDKDNVQKISHDKCYTDSQQISTSSSCTSTNEQIIQPSVSTEGTITPVLPNANICVENMEVCSEQVLTAESKSLLNDNNKYEMSKCTEENVHTVESESIIESSNRKSKHEEILKCTEENVHTAERESIDNKNEETLKYTEENIVPVESECILNNMGNNKNEIIEKDREENVNILHNKYEAESIQKEVLTHESESILHNSHEETTSMKQDFSYNNKHIDKCNNINKNNTPIVRRNNTNNSIPMHLNEEFTMKTDNDNQTLQSDTDAAAVELLADSIIVKNKTLDIKKNNIECLDGNIETPKHKVCVDSNRESCSFVSNEITHLRKKEKSCEYADKEANTPVYKEKYADEMDNKKKKYTDKMDNKKEKCTDEMDNKKENYTDETDNTLSRRSNRKRNSVKGECNVMHVERDREINKPNEKIEPYVEKIAHNENNSEKDILSENDNDMGTPEAIEQQDLNIMSNNPCNSRLNSFLQQIESPNQNHFMFGNLSFSRVNLPARKERKSDIMPPRLIVNSLKEVHSVNEEPIADDNRGTLQDQQSREIKATDRNQNTPISSTTQDSSASLSGKIKKRRKSKRGRRSKTSLSDNYASANNEDVLVEPKTIPPNIATEDINKFENCITVVDHIADDMQKETDTTVDRTTDHIADDIQKEADTTVDRTTMRSGSYSEELIPPTPPVTCKQNTLILNDKVKEYNQQLSKQRRSKNKTQLAVSIDKTIDYENKDTCSTVTYCCSDSNLSNIGSEGKVKLIQTSKQLSEESTEDYTDIVLGSDQLFYDVVDRAESPKVKELSQKQKDICASLSNSDKAMLDQDLVNNVSEQNLNKISYQKQSNTAYRKQSNIDVDADLTEEIIDDLQDGDIDIYTNEKYQDKVLNDKPDLDEDFSESIIGSGGITDSALCGASCLPKNKDSTDVHKDYVVGSVTDDFLAESFVEEIMFVGGTSKTTSTEQQKPNTSKTTSSTEQQKLNSSKTISSTQEQRPDSNMATQCQNLKTAPAAEPPNEQKSTNEIEKTTDLGKKFRQNFLKELKKKVSPKRIQPSQNIDFAVSESDQIQTVVIDASNKTQNRDSNGAAKEKQLMCNLRNESLTAQKAFEDAETEIDDDVAIINKTEISEKRSIQADILNNVSDKCKLQGSGGGDGDEEIISRKHRNMKKHKSNRISDSDQSDIEEAEHIDKVKKSEEKVNLVDNDIDDITEFDNTDTTKKVPTKSDRLNEEKLKAREKRRLERERLAEQLQCFINNIENDDSGSSDDEFLKKAAFGAKEIIEKKRKSTCDTHMRMSTESASRIRDDYEEDKRDIKETPKKADFPSPPKSQKLSNEYINKLKERLSSPLLEDDDEQPTCKKIITADYNLAQDFKSPIAKPCHASEYREQMSKSNTRDKLLEFTRELSPTTPSKIQPIPISQSTTIRKDSLDSQVDFKKPMSIDEVFKNTKCSASSNNNAKLTTTITTKYQNDIEVHMQKNSLTPKAKSTFGENMPEDKIMEVDDKTLPKHSSQQKKNQQSPHTTTKKTYAIKASTQHGIKIKSQEHERGQAKQHVVKQQSPHSTTIDLETDHKELKNVYKKNIKPILMTSRLTKKQMMYCNGTCQRLGGKTTMTYTDNVTHLVVATDENNAVPKESYTYKYLLALVCGMWVVSFKWILESLKNERFVNEEEFEAKGHLESNHMDVPALYRTSVMNKVPGLFHGYRMCLIGDFQISQIGKDQLLMLLQKTGAETVFSLNEVHCSSSQIQTMMLTDDISPLSHNEIELVQKYSLQPVHPDWVVDSIVNFKIQELEQYLIR